MVIGTTELVKIPGFEGTIEDLFEELNANSTVAMMNSQKGFTVSMMMKKRDHWCIPFQVGGPLTAMMRLGSSALSDRHDDE